VVSDEALFERAGREEVINSRGLEKLKSQGEKNKVEGLQIINSTEIKKIRT